MKYFYIKIILIRNLLNSVLNITDRFGIKITSAVISSFPCLRNFDPKTVTFETDFYYKLLIKSIMIKNIFIQLVGSPTTAYPYMYLLLLLLFLLLQIIIMFF